MSLESFFGLESDQPMSESAFEAFKEKMAAAAAQIAAIKKEESKQKKKEDELMKILLFFVKTSHKTELVLLISRALEQNIPANFILAIILLGNPEIQQAVGHHLLFPGQVEAFEANPSEKALIFFNSTDETMPLKIKIELDSWIKNMILQADENPQKLVKTGYDRQMIEIEDENHFGDRKYEERKEVKKVLIQLFAYVMRDFLENRGVAEEHEKLTEFAEFILTGILKKTEENLDQRRFLGGEVSDPI